MNWVVADMLMFGCSVILYVVVRKLALIGLPSQVNNLAMFLIPVPAYVVIAVIGGEHFAVSATQAMKILLSAAVFSYIGNAVSMRSIAAAPNAGYSLVLSKSYVVFTTIWAVAFFNASLSWRAGIAIALIVGSSALIMVRRTAGERATSSSWIPLAIGAFFCWGFLSLMAKHLENQGMPVAVFLLYVSAVVVVLILGEMRYKRVSGAWIKQHWWPFVVIGVASAGFNYFNFYAIGIAPNVGYVNATNAASIAAVAVVSALLFKDELTSRKLAGVAGVVFGLLLLFL